MGGGSAGEMWEVGGRGGVRTVIGTKIQKVFSFFAEIKKSPTVKEKSEREKSFAKVFRGVAELALFLNVISF